MNLSEALDAALPELPKTRLARTRPPCLDPDLLIREEVLDGEPIIGLLQRTSALYFRLSPTQWDLARLFDGSRSYEDIAELFNGQAGFAITPEEVRSFADGMDGSNFWYRSPQEKNLALSEKLTAQRGRRNQSQVNLAHISFSAWDPDQYLAWLDRMAGAFIYGPWCVLSTLLLFGFETVVFIDKWNVIAPDVKLYYTFSEKSGSDIALFWIMLLVLGFLHETAHGLTCRHFGGQVHRMGIMFLYLLPCFFCDVTETWVSASKIQRLYTIIAGIWIEMVVCGAGMILWLNTPAGSWMNYLSYQVVLLTGVAAIVLNLNPLIKLDGYYLITEIIEIPELKERSTAFVSGWFQSHVLRLPVETPIVPRRRVPLFAFYAIASGVYSYSLLFLVVRLSYNVTSKWIAEFALLPAGYLAFVLFKSRLRALRGVAAQWWKQRTESGARWRLTHWAIAVLLAALLFVPLWRDREDGYFVIEPMRTHTLHAAMTGRVDAVLVQGAQRVHSGEPLLRMSSTSAAAMQSSATAQTGSARFQAYNAQLRGQSIGAAAAEQGGAERFTRLAGEARSKLEVAAPSDGIVLTRTPALLLDQNVASGEPLIEVADAGPRIARVFLPSSALDRIPPGAEVALALPGQFSVLRLTLAPPDGDAVPLPAGLVPTQAFKGIQMATYYCSRMELPAAVGNPMFGVSGEAKIFGERRSLAGRFLTSAFNLLKAHVW